MATCWKLGKPPIKDRVMTLEEPGKPFLFDADKGLVEDITSKFSVATLAKSLQGKDEKEALENIREAIVAWLWAEDQKAAKARRKSRQKPMLVTV